MDFLMVFSSMAKVAMIESWIPSTPSGTISGYRSILQA
jgi:hypothetical protein